MATKVFSNGVLRDMTEAEEAAFLTQQQTIQEEVASQPAPVTGEFSQPRADGYWHGWNASDTVLVNRLGGRLLVGAAVDNDATWYEGGTPEAPRGFSDKDWLGQMSRVPINGGMGIGLPGENDINYCQVGILADDIAGTKRAGPLIALKTWVRGLNSKSFSTPRGIDFGAIKNNRELFDLAGHPAPCGEFDGSEMTIAASGHMCVPAWGAYGEVHRLVPGPGNAHTMELESRNAVDLVTWDPYYTPGTGTVTVAFGAGCGLDPKGQFPVTAATYLTANGAQHAAGHIVLDGSIGPYGVGGSRPVWMFPSDYEVQWFSGPGTLAGTITANAGGLHLKAGAMRLTLRPDGMSIMVGTQMKGVFVDPNGFLKV